jgi:hypothetical protein
MIINFSKLPALIRLVSPKKLFMLLYYVYLLKLFYTCLTNKLLPTINLKRRIFEYAIQAFVYGSSSVNSRFSQSCIKLFPGQNPGAGGKNYGG